MTWTSFAYRSITPLTWRGSTSHTDSSWTGGQRLSSPPRYSHGCVMCPVFVQNPAEDEKNSGLAPVTLCKYQLILQAFRPSDLFQT